MNKTQQYQEVLPQLAALIEGERDETAVLANVAALFHTTFGWFWTGFYVVRGEALCLGPFQGPVACYRIPFGRGVCGTAWQRAATVVVPDVEAFPGHIACSTLSKSEIVVPLCDAQGSVRAVLDIDSTSLSTFDDTDRRFLEQAMSRVASQLYG